MISNSVLRIATTSLNFRIFLVYVLETFFWKKDCTQEDPCKGVQSRSIEHKDAMNGFSFLLSLVVFIIIIMSSFLFVLNFYPVQLPFPREVDYIISKWWGEWTFYLILGIGGFCAFATAPIFWVKSCTQELGKIQAVFFARKNRQILTFLLIIFSSYFIGVLIVPTIRENLLIISFSVTLIFALILLTSQMLIFMTFKVGPWSFAYRDRILVQLIEKSSKENSLTEDFVETVVRCILVEVEKGNGKSSTILRELKDRDDEIGGMVRRIVHRLSKNE